ncbi:PfkB family carbohydrate kinase [Pararhizobium sp. O133]|uniref:PfkB family carbohydrate kinase n=1 Tax=Pararhizobium sp. O133 TaxID=3449278 RepID=UPI003F6870DE
MKKLRFATVGDNCIDRFQPPVGQSLVGGNAVNVAVQLAALGHDCFYFGAVGTDPDGARTRRLLRESGLLTDYLQDRTGVTAYTDIAVLESGDRIMTFEDFGVCAGYAPSPSEVEILKAMDHVHIGWLDDGGALKRMLSSAGISVSQDLSVNADPENRSADGLTIAFGSAGEDEGMADKMMADLLSQGARLAVVTRGALGSSASDSSYQATTGVTPVEVIDTTGAGDSFIAGFLSAHIGGQSLESCLEAGRDRAALTCGHVGGFPQDPAPL